MKLDKAIKILESVVPKALPNNPPGYLTAVQLGIEALKQIEVDRRNRLPFQAVLLPGETKE